MEIEFAKLEQRVAVLEKEYQELKNDIEPIHDKSIALDIQYQEIMKSLNELKADVKAIKDSPRVFLNHVIAALISAIVAFVVAQLPNLILGLQHMGV